jgi:ubiquinone/menaquinone biosynthesis C-methylase UbiE
VVVVLAPPSLALARSKLDRALYGAQQLSLFFPAMAAHHLFRVLSHAAVPDVPPEVIREIRRRYVALLRADLANVEANLYPRDLLFQFPLRAYGANLPRLLADMPRTVRRKKARNHRDVPDVDPARFPSYFRRTFHWQTDGYFTSRSARLYDLSVELLFLGTADVMRRQTIPPITRALQAAGRDDGRLLDVGCGTGRLLSQMAASHPALRLFGVDISPAYVGAARALLADVPDVSLVAENAESLPYRDGYFDMVTSVYLFHELPRAVRRVVLREMKRVLAPGGLLVLEDSAQLVESRTLAPTLARFAEEFHEPFYGDYLVDDLAVALAREGFRVESVTPTYLSKVVVARA